MLLPLPGLIINY